MPSSGQGGGGSGQSATTLTNSQQQSVTLYQAGSYCPGSYSLTNFQLTASSDVLVQSGTDTISGSIPGASGTMPSTNSGVSTYSLAQSSSQSQSTSLQEKGQNSQGDLQLSLVSMTLDGVYSTSSTRSSGDSNTQGDDNMTVTGRPRATTTCRRSAATVLVRCRCPAMTTTASPTVS